MQSQSNLVLRALKALPRESLFHSRASQNLKQRVDMKYIVYILAVDCCHKCNYKQQK